MEKRNMSCRINTIGTVVNDVRIITPKVGQPKAIFVVVNRETFRNRDGTSGSRETAINITSWKHIEWIQKNVSKGMQVFIEGRYQTERYHVDGEERSRNH